MIKFFRKIRHTLFNQNRISRYLLYAIGEIILVVIGILIALQINNWNENRHAREEMSKIYVSVIDELESDIKTLDEILPDFEWKNRIIKKIISEPPSQRDWQENDSLFLSFVSFYDFAIGQSRMKLLENRVAYNDFSRELNNRIVDFYNKHLINVEVKTHEANMSYHRNMGYWEENTDWLETAFTYRDFTKLGAYATNSQGFINKLVWYGIVLRRLEGALRSYQSEAKDLVSEIERHLETT